MAKLTRAKSGRWTARKVIPTDVREAYGQREDKPTWPAELTEAAARVEFGRWLAAVEAKIETLRGRSIAPAPLPVLSPPTLSRLSEEDSLALAGHWYSGLEARLEGNYGDPNGWSEAAESLLPHNADTLEAWETPTYVITRHLQRERDALLDDEGLSIDDHSTARLGQDMAGLYLRFCDVMENQRCVGIHVRDETLDTVPAWRAAKAPVVGRVLPATSSAKAGPKLIDLFDGYVGERAPAAATVKSWSRVLPHLINFLGHQEASLVTPEDVVRWKERLLSEETKSGKPRSDKTVRETYLACTKTVFNWAKENRLVQSNPVDGITVRGRKKQQLRDRGFNNDEALAILTATLEEPKGKLSVGNASARRWVPWLCAYSGARVNEVTQLRRQDVFEEDGVWVMHITPEAGSVKTHTARKVPLHDHLIAQGFLEFVRSIEDGGRLFYDPASYRGGSEGNPQYKKVGERLASWVRSLGVVGPDVPPNHGWRHRFKTVAREVGMDPEARELIPGHALSTDGQRYGTWPLRSLKAEVDKFPAIIIPMQ